MAGWQGRLLHIHIAPEAGAAMQALLRAVLIPGTGIAGDRYATGRGKYSAIPDIREVTLIEAETLEALARDHGVTLDVHEHRRNLTVTGVPLNHLVGQQFRVGGVVLEGGRLNTPCRYLDLLTGKAVCDLMVHRSGLNCRVVQGGEVSVGDAVSETDDRPKDA